MANPIAAQAGAALVAALATAWGVRWMCRWSTERGFLDVPNERSSHAAPVPRGGGLVVVAVVLAGLTGAAAFLSALPAAGLGLLGAALVAAVGWRDDVRSLPVLVRLAVHCLAAALVIGSGVSRVADGPLIGSVAFGSFALPLAFLFVVGLTNAYNFMDGIDGIAGGQAIVAGVGWFFAGRLLGCSFVVWAGAVVAGAALGFLVFNWSPARIFMGDVGSGTLGLVFAWLALAGGRCDSRLPFAGLVFVWPFVFDTALTFLRRSVKRENVFSAHRSHLYQRLVISGLSHATVSSIYAGLSFLGVFLTLAWLAGWPQADLVLALALPLAAVALCAAVLVRERRVSDQQ